MTATDWTLAACRDHPERMFPDSPAQTVAAKRVCAGCPVQATCLRRALEVREPWGVWGGLTVAERERHRAGRLMRVCVACRLIHVPAQPERARCVACHPDPGRLAPHQDLIAALAVASWNPTEIGALVGVAGPSVSAALRRWGVPVVRGTGRGVSQPCGTLAAVRRHQRHGERLDAACRLAAQDASAMKERRRGGRRRGRGRVAA